MGAVALGFGLLLSIGFLSRRELAHATHGVETYIPATLGLLQSCEASRNLEPHVKQSLIVYLTIEMRMRPALWRQAEFLIALAGAGIGYQPIKTIGVGQIGFTGFATYRLANTQSSNGPTQWEWISELRDDCKNVQILAWTIRRQDNACLEANSSCVLLTACHLHSGNADACLSKPRFLKYRMAAAAIYSEVSASHKPGSR